MFPLPSSARRWLALASILLLPTWAAAQGMDIESHYSPLNQQREARAATEFIILHTTEGPAIGSLEKLRRYGEAHYMVDTAGKIYRIIERHRIATHAGRSMWLGKTNLDNISIGIEIVGYHDREPTAAQSRAVRELIRQLRGIYRIPDERVLPHSMVAYGQPNRWHTQAHRGRKRCGMLMGTTGVRRQLGLLTKPAYDPDVRAGRLIVADPELSKVLFGPDVRAGVPAPTPAPRQVAQPVPVVPIAPGVAIPVRKSAPEVITATRSAWDIARERYNTADTLYEFPDGKVFRGNQITAWNKIPRGTLVRMQNSTIESENVEERVQVIGRDGRNAFEIAGEAFQKEETIYFLPGGEVKTGKTLTRDQLDQLPNGTGMLVGYAQAGVIGAKKRAFDLCGPRWNLANTFYRLPDGTMRTGDEMNEKNIPNRTLVFLPR
jgi:hypothetical protein